MLDADADGRAEVAYGDELLLTLVHARAAITLRREDESLVGAAVAAAHAAWAATEPSQRSTR